MLEKELTVGQKVIGNWHNYGQAPAMVGEVVRVGKISYSVQFPGESYTRRFNKWGSECGDGYYRGWIEPATPEKIAEVNAAFKARRILNKLSRIDWSKVEEKTREQVYELLKTLGAFK